MLSFFKLEATALVSNNLNWRQLPLRRLMRKSVTLRFDNCLSACFLSIAFLERASLVGQRLSGQRLSAWPAWPAPCLIPAASEPKQHLRAVASKSASSTEEINKQRMTAETNVVA